MSEHTISFPENHNFSYPCGCEWSISGVTAENGYLCNEHDPSHQTFDGNSAPQAGADFEDVLRGEWFHVLEVIGEPTFVDTGITFKCKLAYEKGDPEDETFEEYITVPYEEK